MNLSGIGAVVSPLIGALTIITGPKLIDPAQLGWQVAANAMNQGYPVLVQANSSAERSAASVRLSEAGAMAKQSGVAEDNIVGIVPQNRASLIAGLASGKIHGGLIFVPNILSFSSSEDLPASLAALDTLARYQNTAILTTIPFADRTALDWVSVYRHLTLAPGRDTQPRVMPINWTHQSGHVSRRGTIWFQKATGRYHYESTNTQDRRSALPGHQGRVTQVAFG